MKLLIRPIIQHIIPQREEITFQLCNPSSPNRMDCRTERKKEKLQRKWNNENLQIKGGKPTGCIHMFIVTRKSNHSYNLNLMQLPSQQQQFPTIWIISYENHPRNNQTSGLKDNKQQQILEYLHKTITGNCNGKYEKENFPIVKPQNETKSFLIFNHTQNANSNYHSVFQHFR